MNILLLLIPLSLLLLLAAVWAFVWADSALFFARSAASHRAVRLAPKTASAKTVTVSMPAAAMVGLRQTHLADGSSGL